MAGFLGQDWSWENFKGKGKGILDDPESLTTNPWFQGGMGILSENTKPFGGDPFGAFSGALAGTKKQKEADADRKRIEELRAKIQDIIRQQSLGRTTQIDPRTGAMSTPLPQNQQPPRSIMDLMKASGGQIG